MRAICVYATGVVLCLTGILVSAQENSKRTPLAVWTSV
jgi:hypothetical protein